MKIILKNTITAFMISVISVKAFPQGVGINSTGATPNTKAILDIDAGPGNNKGLLIPRMTTAERDAIGAGPTENSMLIFNTSTQCFEAYNSPSSSWVAFGCIGCTVPSGISASATPNPICEGSTLTLTGTATNATSWAWTGPNSFTSTLQNPTIAGITAAGAGVYTLTASNACAAAPPVNTTSVIVSLAPTISNAGPDQNICASTATLAGNTPTVGAGTWTLISGTGSITSPNSPTSGITGLGTGNNTFRWTIANAPCTSSSDDVIITRTDPPTTASAGSDQTLACDVTTTTLSGNTPSTGTGSWTVVSGTATITTPSSPNSGVTGLAASGSVTLRWTISNAPCASSSDEVVITTVGACPPPPCLSGATPVVAVVSATKTWMDRNLGANQAATSSTDAAAYGCLYQWGRLQDGHESRTSTTTGLQSSSDNPGHANFIASGASDWRSPKNDNLWQGVGGTNNPCPAGYRLPTDTELDAERGSWVLPPINSSNDATGAFASPLKLPVSGRRNAVGTLNDVGTSGWYWSSTVSGNDARYLNFWSIGAIMFGSDRAGGLSVRCIQN